MSMLLTCLLYLVQVVAYTKKGDRLVGQIAKRQVCPPVSIR